jgi:hypothetical protein
MAQPVPTTSTQVPRERIAQRAYEKWQKRGCLHGYDLQDWVEAEAELRAEFQKRGTAPVTGGGTVTPTRR